MPKEGVMECRYCKGKNHTKSNCKELYCKICKIYDHPIWKCPNRKNGRKRSKSDKKSVGAVVENVVKNIMVENQKDDKQKEDIPKYTPINDTYRRIAMSAAETRKTPSPVISPTVNMQSVDKNLERLCRDDLHWGDL